MGYFHWMNYFLYLWREKWSRKTFTALSGNSISLVSQIDKKHGLMLSKICLLLLFYSFSFWFYCLIWLYPQHSPDRRNYPRMEICCKSGDFVKHIIPALRFSVSNQIGHVKVPFKFWLLSELISLLIWSEYLLSILEIVCSQSHDKPVLILM